MSEMSGLAIYTNVQPKTNHMAKVAKKNQCTKKITRKKFEIVNPHAAGIDISPKEMQVCVPSDHAEENNRTFGVFTEDLNEIADWLLECGINTAAMESTGVYWLPLFEVLKDRGINVILVNPRDIRNISGKKTDESDAEWIMLLHTHGMLTPCFQLDNLAREIRNLTRHRDNLIRSSSREVLHLQKAMEQMNLKLDNVFSDILGKSGQAIIHAIIEGERDAEKLADMADPRCKSSRDDIIKSLGATWDEDHLFEMSQSDRLYQFYQSLLKECDQKINELIDRYTTLAETPDGELVRSGKRVGKKNKVDFDIEKYAFNIWGVNVMRMPGMSTTSLLKLVAELGADFVEKFPDCKHFVSWCNLVPNNKISGGELLSSKVPHKKNPVGIIFRQCATAVQTSKNPIGYYFRHEKASSGPLQAMVATGKKLAAIFYTLVSRKVEFDETVYANHRKVQLQNKVEYLRKKLTRMEEELTETSRSAS